MRNYRICIIVILFFQLLHINGLNGQAGTPMPTQSVDRVYAIEGPRTRINSVFEYSFFNKPFWEKADFGELFYLELGANEYRTNSKIIGVGNKPKDIKQKLFRYFSKLDLKRATYIDKISLDHFLRKDFIGASNLLRREKLTLIQTLQTVKLGSYFRVANETQNIEKLLCLIELEEAIDKDEIEKNKELIILYRELGDSYQRKGNIKKLNETNQRILNCYSIISNTINDISHKNAIIQNLVAQTLIELEKGDEARKHYQHAIDIYSILIDSNKLELKGELGNSYNNLATLYSSQFQFQEAIITSKLSLDLYKNSSQKHEAEIATTLANLGNIYIQTQEFDLGEEVLLSSLAKRMQLNKYQSQSLYIGDIYTKLGLLEYTKSFFNNVNIGYNKGLYYIRFAMIHFEREWEKDVTKYKSTANEVRELLEELKEERNFDPKSINSLSEKCIAIPSVNQLNLKSMLPFILEIQPDRRDFAETRLTLFDRHGNIIYKAEGDKYESTNIKLSENAMTNYIHYYKCVLPDDKLTKIGCFNVVN